MANFNQPWNAGKHEMRILPSRKPTLMEIAWAAGVYEGEGTCGVHDCKRKRGSYQVVALRVSQKDRWLCEQLRDLFGGVVRTYKTKANSPKNPNLVREYNCWDIYGSRALGFVQTIYQFLSPRRQGQIRTVLDAVRRVPELEQVGG